MSAVRLEGVFKSYGSQPALQGMSFELPRGAICGLIGPNGSGKTTSMGLIAGLLRSQRGQIDVLGQGAFSAQKHAGKVSLMPQDCAPSLHVSLRESLRFYARLQGLEPRGLDEEVQRRLTEVKLLDRAASKYGQLSHGMKRRFSIAQALLGAPELIMLDEPTSGLDPELVVQIRELLAGQRGHATLLVSSHVLSELELLCDYVVIIEGGRCVRQGSLREVTSGENTVRFTLSTAPDLASLQLALQACTLEWKAPVLTVRAPLSQSVEETNQRCLRALLDSGTGIREVRSGESLEQSYLRSAKA